MRSPSCKAAVPVLSAVGLLSLTTFAAPAQAQTLNGGGSSSWTTQNDSTFGFSIDDAGIVGQSDAFDDGLVTSINGTVFQASTVGSVVATAAGESLTGTGTAAGLNVTKELFALASAPVLRTLISFQNPTASAVTISLLLQTNVGSDGSTQVITTASGDTTFTTADGWIITDDSTAGGDPTNTHFLFGAGGLAPSTVGLTVFSNFGTQGVSAEWVDVLVGAGETTSFVFFNRLDTTAANAQSFAPTFNSSAGIEQAGLLTGLSAGQVAGIRNISGAAAAVPEPATFGLFGVGALIGVVGVARRRRSAK